MTISRSIFALLKSEEKTASSNQERQDQRPTYRLTRLANEQIMIRSLTLPLLHLLHPTKHLTAFAPGHIQTNGGNENRTFDNHLRVRFDSHQRHAIIETRHDKRTQYRAEDSSPPAH